MDLLAEVCYTPSAVDRTTVRPAKLGQLEEKYSIDFAASDHRFMEEALKEARIAFEKGEIPVGAVVVEAGMIVARAHNLRELTQDPTAHAELLALRRAARKTGLWKRDGATLYVTLEPCAMCAGALVESRVANLYYGAASPERGCAGSLVPLADLPGAKHQVRVYGGLKAEASQKLLREFFDKYRGEVAEPG